MRKMSRRWFVLGLVLFLLYSIVLSTNADTNDYADISIDTNVSAGSTMYMRIKKLSLPDYISGSKVYYETITTSKGKVYTYSKGTIEKGETVDDYWVSLRIDDSDPLGYYKGTLHVGDKKISVWGLVVDKITKMKGNIISVKSPTKRKLSLKWKKIKYATGYQLLISTTKDFSRNSFKTNFKNTSTVKIAYRESKKNLYLKMRPYKKRGKKTYYGKWSNVRKVWIK